MNPINEFNTVTGKKLNPMESYVNTQGQTITQGSVITPQALAPVPKIDLSGTTPPVVDSGAGVIAGATQGTEKFDTEAEFQRQLELQNKTNADQSSLTEAIKQLTASEQGLGGRGTAQLEAETTAGIPEAQKQRSTLQGQIKTQIAEYNILKAERDKLTADLEVGTRGTGNADIRASMLFGQQGAVERQYLARLNNKLSEIGLLQAQDEALKGDIETAQKSVDRAIDLKYQDREAENKIKQSQYDRIKSTLDAEQTKRGKALEETLEKEAKALEEEKAKEKDISKMIIDATPNAPVNIIANAKAIADKGGSTLEVAQALGKYGGDYLGDMVKRASIAKSNADVAKANKEIAKLTAEIKTLNTPINTTNLPATTTGFITKLMASAKNEKDLDASERQSLSKARTVIGQLDSLQTNIAKQNKTGFIKGKVNNLLEQVGLNADVGVINAQLQAVVPNLARGTYGEVGVLTDNDIANYRKTLPRLTSPKDQNDAVMAMTLKTVLNSIENTLSTASNSNINVSGWTQDYLKVKNQINTIEDRIGVSKEAVNDLIRQDKTLAEPIKEMYRDNLTDGEILEALNAR